MIVFAPGKLVLVGEYAVLDGGGAVVAAVNRGVSCAVSPAATLAIVTPGDDTFVRAALAGAPPARYTFADWNPVDLGGAKPGFGGSAAATVAAVVAAGLPPARAYAAHHAVQGGGSGVDIFASLLGGVRRFPDGAALDVPAPLAVWSGASAATGPRVARYRAWEGRAAFVAASRALVDAFAAEPIRVTRAAYALLTKMAEAAGLAYDTPAHARIARLAADHGGAAKPSGAGGGDVAVAFLPDPDARAAFAVAAAAEGLLPLPVQLAPGAWTGPVSLALPPA
jgi:phosphomevalonate kinase